MTPQVACAKKRPNHQSSFFVFRQTIVPSADERKPQQVDSDFSPKKIAKTRGKKLRSVTKKTPPVIIEAL